MGRRRLQALSATLGAAGIAAAAYGAHGLEKVVGPTQLRWWAIAVSIQLVTAPVIMIVALSEGKLRPLAGQLLGLGVGIFSGSLYAMSLGAPRWFGAITPLGGLALIAGWLLLAVPPRK